MESRLYFDLYWLSIIEGEEEAEREKRFYQESQVEKNQDQKKKSFIKKYIYDVFYGKSMLWKIYDVPLRNLSLWGFFWRTSERIHNHDEESSGFFIVIPKRIFKKKMMFFLVVELVDHVRGSRVSCLSERAQRVSCLSDMMLLK